MSANRRTSRTTLIVVFSGLLAAIGAFVVAGQMDSPAVSRGLYVIIGIVWLVLLGIAIAKEAKQRPSIDGSRLSVQSSSVTAASWAPYSRLAVSGFVLAFTFPLVGVFLSHVGLSDTKKLGKRGRGLAIAGLILNYLFIVLGLVVSAVATALLAYWCLGETLVGGLSNPWEFYTDMVKSRRN